MSDKGAEIKGLAEGKDRQSGGSTARKCRERIDKSPANLQPPGTGYCRLAARFARRGRAVAKTTPEA